MRTNCPNCGAPINTDYIRCQYCGTPHEVENGRIEITADALTIYADNLPVYSVDDLKQQIENARYARRTEELYSEAVSAISTSRYQGEIEEKLTMVKESLDDIERNYQPFWANLIFVLVMMWPVIITVLSILFE